MTLLSQIPKEMYPRLTLHQTPGVISKLSGGDVLGFQSNSRCPQIPAGSGLRSVSCHSLSEIRKWSLDPAVHYQTLSPIFDSISKPGYRSPFRTEDLKDIPAGTVALGGVTPQRIPILKENGFSGAAILGWVWRQFDSYGCIGDLKRKLRMYGNELIWNSGGCISEINLIDQIES